MNLKRTLLPCIFGLILAGLGLVGPVLMAQAAGPWYVSPTGNNSNCLSLATACKTIAAAINKAASGDTVIIAAGTYTENLILTKTITLQGAGASSTIVDGNAAGSVFSITANITVTITDVTITHGRAIDGGGILNKGTLTLKNCTISNNIAIGKNGGNWEDGAPGTGGGIRSDGTLIINDCLINGNTANGGTGGSIINPPRGYGTQGGRGQGGGIFSKGILILNSCIISGNTAAGGKGGDNFFGDEGNGGGGVGGGLQGEGTLILNTSIITGNTANGGEGGGDETWRVGVGRAGGIVGNGILIFNNSKIINNTATDGGGISYSGGNSGGIFSGSPAVSGGLGITLTNSVVSSNTALLTSPTLAGSGGGIIAGCSQDISCTLALINSVVNNNYAARWGGGIISGVSTTTVSASAIYSNSARWGGGIQIGGVSTIINSTISDNIARDSGGGIYAPLNQSTYLITMLNTTLVNNSAITGGGLYVSNNGIPTIALKNSIVANNLSGGNCFISSGGTITSNGHNLDSGSTCGFAATGDITNTNPLLGPLQNNGASTPTHALLVNSPAIDTGDDSACPTTDQRGQPRPIDGDNNGVAQCDMGAYEANLIQVTKTANVSTAQVGQTLTYTYHITNTSDVTLTDLAANDDKLGPVTLNLTALAPNQSATGTLTYLVSESDLPGPLTNTVVVSGTPPTGPVVTASDIESVALTSNPALAVSKTANTSTAQISQTLTYSYRITNTGDVTLTGLTATDDKLGQVNLTSTTLAPDQVTTGILTYTVIAADLPGPLTNTVVVSGTPPTGPVITSTDSASVILIPPDNGSNHSVYLPVIVKNK